MATTAFIQIGTGQRLTSKLSSDTFMWVISPTEIGLGNVPLQAQYVLDLGTEELRESQGSTVPTTSAFTAGTRQGGLRGHTGRYLFEILGKTVECASLKDMLKKGLLAIEGHHPGMLSQLTKVKPRTKRIVAQKADELFEDPILVSKYSDELKPGWYYGTNNSADETKGWLKRACEIAKLQWGKDFDVSI